MLIHKRIGNTYDSQGNVIEYGINGSDFANEMQYLKSVCKNITVSINSEGGNVLDGYSIVSAIINAKANTSIEGLAASTALWCASVGIKRTATDYSSGMMHNSSGAENDTVSSLIDGSITTILSNSCAKTPEEIGAMMNKTTWMNASELLASGLVDEVIPTGKRIKIKKNESLLNVVNIYNDLNKPNMSKLNTLLKLSNSAEVSEQETAVAKLNADNATLTARNVELEAKLKVVEDAAAAKEAAEKLALTNDATALVNQAFTDKKITEAEKAAMLENASASRTNFEFVKNMIGKMKGATEAHKIFDPTKIKNSTGGTEDRSTWKFSDWSKKDSKGLGVMQNENPEAFKELYNAEYKK